MRGNVVQMKDGIKRSTNYIAIPPGVTIKEQLQYKNMNQKEFALRMGLTEKHTSRLINGKVELTYGISNKLESVTGIPAEFWNNLESRYREKLKKVEEELEIESELLLLEKYPYSILVQNNDTEPRMTDREEVRGVSAEKKH